MVTIADHPSARERHLREMAVWHEWPVDEQRAQKRSWLRPNVSDVGRAASLLVGSVAAGYGLSKRGALGWGLVGLGGGLLYRGLTGHCHLYGALGITTASRGSAEPVDYYEYGVQVTKSVTIDASPESLYRFWRDFTNLPRIMSHLESVNIIDDVRSHWVAKGPMGSHIEWDAEIINEEPHELIAWRSLPGAEIDNAGSVRFVRAPAGRGTQVHVNIEYIPVAGKIGTLIAKMFGEEPNQQVREDLRRFKQVMEAGEIPSTEGQPMGKCAGRKAGYARLHRARQRRGFTGSPNYGEREQLRGGQNGGDDRFDAPGAGKLSGSEQRRPEQRPGGQSQSQDPSNFSH